MQTKLNRPVQIATLAFALTVLATYVVYSQRQRTRTAAPTSPVTVTTEVKGGSTGGAATNQLEPQRTTLVAPGSKVMAPILDVRSPKAAGAAPAPTEVTHPAMFAPGSKSAAVFDLRQQPQAQIAKEAAVTQQARRATNSTARPHL